MTLLGLVFGADFLAQPVLDGTADLGVTLAMD
jgi:hypothetical protein